MADRVPAVLTPCTVEEVFDEFVVAYYSLFNKLPSQRTVFVLMAQSAQETRRWQAMYNFNLGNIKAKVAGNRPYYMLATTEVLSSALAASYVAQAGIREDGSGKLDTEVLGPRGDGLLVKFYPPHPATAFRALEALSVGVADHFAFLAQPRFARALAAADAGDPAIYAVELRLQIYYTELLETYRKGLVSLTNEYQRTLGHLQPRLPPDPPVFVTPFSLQDITHQIINEDFRNHGLEEDGGEEVLLPGVGYAGRGTEGEDAA